MASSAASDLGVAPPVREAATVMLVRDAPHLEVFMLRRNLGALWVGGAHVFPGGAVDGDDRDERLLSRCDGPDDATASRLLGHDSGGLGYWVAAIRETFEEAGVLLALHSDGSLIDPRESAWGRLVEARYALNAGDCSFIEVVESEDLMLACSSLMLFSHWITPVGMPRRYDTWFFVAAAPEGHSYLHDDGETVESAWKRPPEAVAEAERDEIDLILPTRRSLDALSHFLNTEGLFSHIEEHAGEGNQRLPMVLDIAGGERLALPGETTSSARSS
ncbi:MAG: hypothetical protein F2894_03300 [Actinobacteria bacterium]|uniref:Unannotated protein n=1 Tax=freshwater metagenome TaxID=449393 RepID=A0A6J6KHK4_9ZZZZ|nr:hypothetical protein [Actinomycetota bacterium]MSY05936.1 hypothetical protein [Actinomycetota bacterium]MSZ28949.1 hypothetical protein [Actinomycetota bacterium]